MAYGDNRNTLATDPFTASISADWDNGHADFRPFAWNAASSGVIQPGAAGAPEAGMRRITETFTGDHYSTATVQTLSPGDCGIGVLVRVHPDSTTDESCYYCDVEDFSTDVYRIYEVSSAFGFTQRASASWAGSPFAAGETMTAEAEGTTIRFGTAEGGGADTQRVTYGSASLSGATYNKVGLTIYTGSSASDGRITSWEGGSIGAVGGGTYNAVPLLQYYQSLKRGGIFH